MGAKGCFGQEENKQDFFFWQTECEISFNGYIKIKHFYVMNFFFSREKV